MTEALAKHDTCAGAVNFRQATDVAGICKQIVVATAIEIQHRKYVRVEGWQAIAVAHGCMASARDVERIEGGFRAIGEVRRGTDGMVLSAAEGFVGDDEDTWGKRPEYAKRAMAQTRAISRACRSAFAHVVVMMNAGLETTPAEEVPLGGFNSDVVVRPKDVKPLPTSVATPVAAIPPQAPPPVVNEAVTVEVVLGEAKEQTKPGKTWKRTYAKADDGEFYSTFDTKLGQFMRDLQGGEALLTYVIKDGAKGPMREVIAVRPVTPPAEEPDADMQRKGGKELPF